jgi:hypothetical protein
MLYVLLRALGVAVVMGVIGGGGSLLWLSMSNGACGGPACVEILFVPIFYAIIGTVLGLCGGMTYFSLRMPQPPGHVSLQGADDPTQ